mmetsp:Transcript_10744/g.27589  ORF Transcript_10744/g.27589 Transcript_10744/m.27589 type:complete len:81 (-) Transcript_10744:513-755(-)
MTSRDRIQTTSHSSTTVLANYYAPTQYATLYCVDPMLSKQDGASARLFVIVNATNSIRTTLLQSDAKRLELVKLDLTCVL